MCYHIYNTKIHDMHGRNGTQSSTDSYFLRYTPEPVAEDALTTVTV